MDVSLGGCLKKKMVFVRQRKREKVVFGPGSKEYIAGYETNNDEITGCKMDGILRKRAIFPRRFEGLVPGVSPVAEAAHVASAMLLNAFISEHLGRAESPSGHELPLGIESPKARHDQRAQMAVGDYSSLSREFSVRPRRPPKTRPTAM